MKQLLPVLFILISFLLLKIVNLDIRLSDSNIYFYTGYQLLQGKVLYRDIFFTNFPLLPYASALYFLAFFGNLKLFFLTPALEAAGIGFMLYFITIRQTKNALLAALCSLLYLCSFMVLSTSDHQTGVFLASLFAVFGYYFFEKKKYKHAGIFLGCMLLTKAYFLPVFLTFLAVLLVKKQLKQTCILLSASLITAVIILLPTLLFAFPEFIQDVFSYSLTRSQGVEKGRIIWFFLTHDFVLFMLLIANLYLITKKHFFGFLSLFGLIFFFFYQDIYYLYLNFLIPFLALSLAYWYQLVQKHITIQRFILPTILCLFLFYNFFTYLSGYKDLQKIDVSAISEAVKQQNPTYLYGINSLTPAVAYLTDIPLLNNVIDTNPNIYRKGFLSAEKMTRDALQNNTVIITEGVDYPIYNYKEDITGEIFVIDALKKNCKVLKSFPVQTEGLQNRINMLSC